MRGSLFFKTFISYLAITLGLSVLVLFFSYHAIRRSYIATFTNELTDLCNVVQPRALLLLQDNNLSGLDDYIKTLEVQTNKRMTVISPDGTVLADSENNPALMSNHKTRPEVQQALRGMRGVAIRYSSTVKEAMLYIAVPLTENGSTHGILRASMFLRDINTLLKSIMQRMVVATALTLLIALLVAFAFARSMSVPIAELAAASRKIAAGDFDTTVTVHRTDNELKALADNFNLMTGRIRSLFRDLSRKKDELNVIINSITEGLFVIDAHDKILLCNESFTRLSNDRDAAGRFYWEALRAPQLTALIKKAREEKTAVIDELELNGRVFAASAAPTLNGDSQVVVLHDITDIKNLERKKKELVANVSHELRTPLTAIKGFAETLEDETTAEGKRYVAIIRKHAERLINIVKDLLLLAQTEEKSFTLRLAETNIAESIASAVKLFDSQATAKKLSITISAAENMASVRVDQFMLEQVLINLIDNAVSYTDTGTITVSARQDQKNTVITIADTGIGIAKEDLPFLFERFYVADKSRSRKSGGTGLGLSIVKHIVMLHQGTISVESSIGAGTRFTVTLPFL